MRQKTNIIIKVIIVILIIYVLLHLALVPIFSCATKDVRNKNSSPKKWGFNYTEHLVKSQWGIELPGWYIPGKSKMPIIIVLTGSGGSKYGTITKWPTVYLHQLGYNLFLVDTRGQGHSSGFKTFGIGKAVDLVHVLDYLSENFPGHK